MVMVATVANKPTAAMIAPTTPPLATDAMPPPVAKATCKVLMAVTALYTMAISPAMPATAMGMIRFQPPRASVPAVMISTNPAMPS